VPVFFFDVPIQLTYIALTLSVRLQMMIKYHIHVASCMVIELGVEYFEMMQHFEQ
jgi:hypothetical protein